MSILRRVRRVSHFLERAGRYFQGMWKISQEFSLENEDM